MKGSLLQVLLVGLALSSGQERYSADLILEILSPDFGRLDKLNILCKRSEVDHKAFMRLEIMVRKSYLDSMPDESVVFCLNDGFRLEFFNLLNKHVQNAYSKRWLVIGSTQSIAMVVQNGHISINKQVTFLDTDLDVLVEIYHINQEQIKTIIGNFSLENHTLTWTKTNNKRWNFEGISFNAKVHLNWYPLAYILPEAQPTLKWKRKERSLTAEVNSDITKGTFVDVVHLMESDLNFTTRKTVAQKVQVGYPIRNNGTLNGWTGYIGDLLSNEVDIIVSPVPYTIDKQEILSFMHTIDFMTPGLFVRAEAGNEEEEWLTYVLPLRMELWKVLIFNALVITLIYQTCHYILECNGLKLFTATILKATSYYWSLFFSYFGWPNCILNDLYRLHMYEISLVIMLVSGNLVAMSYRAALTYRLSVKKYALPFNSIEGFYESDFR